MPLNYYNLYYNIYLLKYIKIKYNKIYIKYIKIHYKSALPTVDLFIFKFILNYMWIICRKKKFQLKEGKKCEQ